MSDSGFEITIADWQADQAALTALRFEVFVDEQKVPPQLELDGLDPECQHIKALSADGELIGTARLLPDHHVGRMCVRHAARQQGVGSAILRFMIGLAKQQQRPLLQLNAQLSALTFYARFGFQAQGEVFLDAGIEHRKMTLIIEP